MFIIYMGYVMSLMHVCHVIAGKFYPPVGKTCFRTPNNKFYARNSDFWWHLAIKFSIMFLFQVWQVFHVMTYLTGQIRLLFFGGLADACMYKLFQGSWHVFTGLWWICVMCLSRHVMSNHVMSCHSCMSLWCLSVMSWLAKPGLKLSFIRAGWNPVKWVKLDKIGENYVKVGKT